MIDRKLLFRKLSFAVYFLAVFLIFLLLLFPFDRLRSKIESEVRLRTPVEISIARISPRFFNRFVLSDVVVSDREGRVLFESPSVTTRVSLFGLLRGRLSLDMKALAYGGDILVKIQQGPDRQHLRLDASGLDVGASSFLKDLGLTLSGKLGGNFEMTNNAGKGRLWLTDLTSRELNIQGFSIPDLDFDKCWFEGAIKGDRLTIKKMELDGKELKLRVLGNLVLRERGSLNLTVKLKPSERLAREQAMIIAFLKNKDSDGFYQFGLGGTLSEPLPRL
jgi:type II secretion system protein N